MAIKQEAKILGIFSDRDDLICGVFGLGMLVPIGIAAIKSIISQ